MFQAPTPHPSPLPANQLYHLLLLISFWLNWLSSLSPLLLQIIAKENCLSFLLGFWSPSITLRLNFYATSLLSWFLTLLGSGDMAQSRGWLTDNDWVKHSTFHSCTVHREWTGDYSILLQYAYSIHMHCKDFQQHPWHVVISNIRINSCHVVIPNSTRTTHQQ